MADLRALFRESSGRIDMLDDEIDLYLNAGRRFLANNLETEAPDFDEELNPLPVVYAAMYKYDYLYRNRAGALEWLEQLASVLKEENHIFIEQISKHITVLGG